MPSALLEATVKRLEATRAIAQQLRQLEGELKNNLPASSECREVSIRMIQSIRLAVYDLLGT